MHSQIAVSFASVWFFLVVYLAQAGAILCVFLMLICSSSSLFFLWLLVPGCAEIYVLRNCFEDVAAAVRIRTFIFSYFLILELLLLLTCGCADNFSRKLKPADRIVERKCTPFHTRKVMALL